MKYNWQEKKTETIMNNQKHRAALRMAKEGVDAEN